MSVHDVGQIHLLGLALLAGLAVLLLVWGYLMRTAKAHVAAETDEPALPQKEEETFILHRITERLGVIVAASVLRSLSEERRAGIHKRLEAAGRPDGLTVERYVRRKVGEVLLYGTGACFLLLNGNALVAVLVLGFAALTDLELYTKAQQRQEEIQQQLPDFLDVLAVTVGAGLSFRQALERTAESMPGTLAEEIRLVLRQMDVGTPRREAFEALRRRNGNEALGKFVTAMQQAEELGAPLTSALIEISQDVRSADFQYLRQKAQKINPKVVGITAVTMLPGTLILIMGGLVLSMDLSGLDFLG